ncbi:MAG: AAA-like domain-containing protein [Cyanobacteria bacterium P01_F01_bin.56]
MGKTSLMSRILRHAEAHECLTVPLSFQLADAAIFSDLDKFLRWFCASVGRRRRLPNKLNEYWDEIFGSKDNCTAYLEEYLLPAVSQPLVLGLDEVDMVFEHPNIAADFMGLLRAWHESAKTDAIWKKLRLVVVHSTEVYIPMNINQSPFNVGLPIELLEFLPEQVLDLAHRHGLPWDEEAVTRLMQMVGGHPYLVRVALYQLSRQETSLDELLTVASTEAGPYGDHLRRHWWNLEQRGEMAEAAKRVVASSASVRLEPIQAFQLHSMGIVHLRGNDVIPRCDLYRHYFSERFNVGRA